MRTDALSLRVKMKALGLILSALFILTGCISSPSQDVAAGTILSARAEGGEALSFRVERVLIDPKDSRKELYLYELSVRGSASEPWLPYCRKDADGKNLAIPLSGTWDSQGRHHPSASLLTFACTNGVIGKCVRWGYHPERKRSDVSLRKLHQACTRMARADYCGLGEPHTRDGTLINMYDRFGIQARADDPKLQFEAAWGPDGAVFLARPRYGGESLQEIVGRCPEKLKGRTSLDHPHFKPEDAAALGQDEALIFSDSAWTSERP